MRESKRKINMENVWIMILWRIFSSVIHKMLIDGLDHIEIHFGPWNFGCIFNFFIFSQIFVSTLTVSICVFGLRMICPHPNDKGIFLFLSVLLWIVEYTMNMIFAIDFLFDFRVVFFSFWLF